MADHFGEWIVGISVVLLILAFILISPLGSGQMYLIVAYLFATPVVGGLLYMRARRRWRR